MRILGKMVGLIVLVCFGILVILAGRNLFNHANKPGYEPADRIARTVFYVAGAVTTLVGLVALGKMYPQICGGENRK